MRIKRTGHGALVAAALAAVGLAGCSFDTTSTTQKTRVLDDRDRDGLLEELIPDGQNAEDGCIIIPEEGNCPVMEWTETHTVTTDAMGNVISESVTVCTQCFEEDGETPIGDQECFEQPPLPPDVVCEEYPSMDPNGVCYRCVAADGTVIEEGCYDLPTPCASDAECPAGQTCQIYDVYPVDPMDPSGGAGTPPGGGMGDPPLPPPPVGYCAAPDPCQPVPGLPGDPTGQSCWECVDPMTGETFGWCDVHSCESDADCSEWETCDPMGYCTYEDPCKPAPGGIPSDPTGFDCWVCEGPMESSWCNGHTCNTDADCAPTGETCNEATGRCEWVDPCTPVESLPSDPNGFDCYQCTGPDGSDWGGYCNGHTCNTDDDCLNTMSGDTCAMGVCVWNGGGCGGDPGQPPPPEPLPPGGGMGGASGMR